MELIMNNCFVVSFLCLLVLNAVLWIWMLFKSKSDEDIVRIIGKALEKGESLKGSSGNALNRIRVYPETLCLPDNVSKADFVKGCREILLRMDVLCDHLGVKIETQLAQAQRYIVVKKQKKT